MEKVWYVYMMECYSAMEKSEMMPFAATWMDLNIIILGEVGQTDRDRYHVMSLICGLKKKKRVQMNLLSRQKQTHSF